jgi:hypothetical protein
MRTEFRRGNLSEIFTRKTGRDNFKLELREVDGTSLASCEMEDFSTSVVASSGSVPRMLIYTILSFHGNCTMKSSKRLVVLM